MGVHLQIIFKHTSGSLWSLKFAYRKLLHNIYIHTLFRHQNEAKETHFDVICHQYLRLVGIDMYIHKYLCAWRHLSKSQLNVWIVISKYIEIHVILILIFVEWINYREKRQFCSYTNELQINCYECTKYKY